MLPLLLHGIPLILAPSPLPEAVRLAAAVEPALTLAAVPALWRAWHEAGAIPPQTRLAISAGAPLPAALERAVFEASGLKIHNFYGSSECGGIAFDTSNEPRPDDDCVGTPMRNVQVALNEDGCLQVTSRAVGETYWPEPDDTLGGGRFQTSDLAEIADGCVYLRGRLGDYINIAGRKVSPASIERVLAQHSAVHECLVFGVPSDDADRTEIIVACVAARAPILADELRHFLLARLPSWQVPRKWWFAKLTAGQRARQTVARRVAYQIPTAWRSAGRKRRTVASGAVPGGAGRPAWRYRPQSSRRPEHADEVDVKLRSALAWARRILPSRNQNRA